jgi:HK97 family phage portal protein
MNPLLRIVRSIMRPLTGWWFGDYIAGGSSPIPSSEWSMCTTADASVGELLTLPAVARGIAVYADSVGSLPRRVVRRVSGGGVEIDDASDAARVLASVSYFDLDAFSASAIAYGNGYALIERNARGGADALAWVLSQRVTPQLDQQGRLWYRIAPDASLGERERTVSAADMLHVKFRGTVASNRFLGVSPLAACASSLAGLLRAQQYQAELLLNVKTPMTVLTTPGKLGAELQARLRTEWNQAFGRGNRGNAAVMEGGLKVEMLNAASAVDAQLDKQSEFGIAEVSRALGVPLSLLSQPGSVAYSQAVEETRSFAALSLQPFCARMADEFAAKLLTPAQRMQGFTIEFDLTRLLVSPGEVADRMSKLANGGLLTPNECRNQLGHPDIVGGDQLRVPVNTQRLSLWLTTTSTAQPAKNHETPDEVGDAIEESATAPILRAVS